MYSPSREAALLIGQIGEKTLIMVNKRKRLFSTIIVIVAVHFA
jgi:hypothetical protein